MATYTLQDIREASVKVMDPWWVHYVMTPFSVRLTWLLANYTRVTPNQISFVGFALGMAAAICFFIGTRQYLILGAVLYHLVVFFDTVDGKMARVSGGGSPVGAFVDTIVNHGVYLMAAFALAVGNADQPLVQWSATALLGLRAVQVVLNAHDGGRPDVDVHTPIHPDSHSWYARHGLLYPLTTPDREIILYFLGPITGLVGPALLLGVVMDIGLAGIKLRRILRQVRSPDMAHG